MTPDNDIDSPAADDTSSLGSVGGNGGLNKGVWTPAEDEMLLAYVNEHGEGNWNEVAKHSGLARCGKSCRLRWTNYLRPDLKKGALTSEEEHLIIELHAKMGNKWARIAAELPGRTDNEIKNYWNSRIKKQQRLGLPIYPPEICSQVLDENQHEDGDGHCRDVMPADPFEIPPIRFTNLDLDRHIDPPPLPGSSFRDISTGDLLGHGLHPSHPNNSLLSTMHPSNYCLQGSESISSAMTSNIIPSGSQYQSGSYVQNAQSFLYPSPYDHRVHAGSHDVLIGNPSSSDPTWAMKQGLPSLQTQGDNWGLPSFSMSSLEYADTLIQTPPTESGPLSSQNSGLLDAILQESQTRKNPRNSSDLLLSSQASDMVTNLTDGSSQIMHEMGWESYEELPSLLGHSSSSMFSEPEAGTGPSGKEEEAIWDPTQYNKTTNQMFSRPDLLLDSDRCGPEKKS